MPITLFPVCSRLSGYLNVIECTRSGGNYLGARKSIMRAWLFELAQRIAHHDVLPAQARDREIVALGQVAAVEVGRQKIVRVRRKFQERLVDVAGTAGRAFMYVIGGERLGRACEPVGLVLPPADGPGIGRALKGTAIA